MKLKSLIKKNKVFTALTLIFCIWIILLILSAIIGDRKVVFYDALGQVDVSSNYISMIPILRYIIEPFVAISFIVEYQEFSWLILFFIMYPIIRIIYLLLKKKGKIRSKKLKYLSMPIADLITFSFKILTLTVLIIAISMLIGYLIQGFLFVSRYFMVPIQIGIHLCMILIIIKALYTLLKIFHPKLKLNYSAKIEKHKTKNRLKLRKINKELVYLVGIGVILIGTNIVLISIPFPTHKIKPVVPLDDDEFLFDFHVHTIMSDGWLTVEERIQWYISHGISGAAFTDHDNQRGAILAQEYVNKHGLDFTVLMGEEWTDHENDIHMNYFGLAEEIVPLESYTPGGPTAMNASDLINYIKANGGYITVNHYNYKENPNGGYGVPYNLTQLMNWGVDGFEIVNGGSYQNKYIHIRQFCRTNNLTCMGGSDIHTNEDLNTFTKLKLTDPTNLSVANIFETLKLNTHEVIAIEFYPKVVDFPGDLNDLGFYILEDFINYILGADAYQSLSWIIWSGLVYFLFFLGYRKVKQIDLRTLRNKFY